MENEVRISPEALEVAKTYLVTQDSKETALSLNITPEEVSYYLRKPEVKRFIDTIFLEQGYMNKNKLQAIMDKLFDLKVEEMEEAEIGTNKDILDLVALQHKMRMEELKLLKETQAPIKNQVNIQNNLENNYSSLMNRLIKAGES